MTEAQKFRFYLPAWNALAKANGWRMANGRIMLDQTIETEEMAKVLIFAQQRATMARRGLMKEDIRHGCHILALGKDKSSMDLTNAEIDRVVTLFQYLGAPENLTFVMKWQAYLRGEDPGAVNRVEYFIRRCPDAYVRAVSADKFGTRNWENLTVKQKGLLSMTLANRRPQRPGRTAAAAPQPEPVAAGEPDWSVE